jgi:hypothetical protein
VCAISRGERELLFHCPEKTLLEGHYVLKVFQDDTGIQIFLESRHLSSELHEESYKAILFWETTEPLISYLK